MEKKLYKKNTDSYLSVLFDKFKEGDDEAFAFFYEYFINDMFAYGVSICGEQDVVKDAIQDIFLNLYFKDKDFSSIEHLKYTLLKSLKNNLYNIYKSLNSSAKTKISEDVLNLSIKTTVLDDIIQDEDRTIIKSQIEELFSCLTFRQKEIIYLRFIKELDYEDIANIMDITVHAARKLISRSLKRMRES